jgi:hypothetical protein
MVVMSRTNTKSDSRVLGTERLAGGYGPFAAKQDAEAHLRRLVLTCLLWEDVAYEDGTTVASQIKELVPRVEPKVVAALAVEARCEQKLRHVPLLISREMCRHANLRPFVAETLEKVIQRPDELAEFLSIYWKDNDGKKSIAKQAKVGLAAAFRKFDEYQLAKWDRSGLSVKLRDVLFLCHAKAQDEEQDALWKRLINGELKTPDTWEVGLSAAKSPEEKRAVWTRLIEDQKLGAFALLKNLRNMIDVKVPRKTITEGIAALKPTMLLPLDFLKAAKYAPDFTPQLEDAMLKCAGAFPKLPGWTILVVDVSGSMNQNLARKSEFNRMDAAAAMAVLAKEMCESVSVYATAGDDGSRVHQTAKIQPLRGFGLSKEILRKASSLGGGGIFTRQCLEFIREKEREVPDRIVIFSDSQDCDHPGKRTPKPFGKRNYIVDVSSHKHGVNYAGAWTAEISGWSEAFLRFIAAVEASN